MALLTVLVVIILPFVLVLTIGNVVRWIVGCRIMHARQVLHVFWQEWLAPMDTGIVWPHREDPIPEWQKQEVQAAWRYLQKRQKTDALDWSVEADLRAYFGEAFLPPNHDFPV